MHVVVFPGWYPNRIDNHSGDFIQRHVYAIAPHARLSVVFPAKDYNALQVEKVEIKSENFTEHFYYYPSFSSIQWLDGLVSFLRYNFLCLKAAREIKKTEKIDLIHLYVLQKNYLLGFFLKWIYNIPYIVSEQSTIYVEGSFEKKNFLLRKIYRLAFETARSWHGVSKVLVNTIQKKLGLKKEGIVIANVVDTNLFYHKPHTNIAMTFVHVSNMFYQKNVEGMLQAFAKVKAVNSSFILNLVGPMPAAIKELITQLNLQENVVVHGAKTNAEVAAIMQHSDVFVFFTRYETFGCVIIEANACGLPVIVTNLEVTRELIKHNGNGLLVENENTSDLAEKILYSIHHLPSFDSATIAAATKNAFNLQKIGKAFKLWYETCL